MEIRLYISADKLSTEHGIAQIKAAVATPGIGAVFAGINWCDLEPENGDYTSAPINAVRAAIPKGMPLHLGIVAGQHCPAWLTNPADGNCPSLTLDMAITPKGALRSVRYALPWTEPYSSNTIALYDWLGERDDIDGYKLGLTHGLDSEMTCQAYPALGRSKSRYDDQFAAAGYTSAGMIAAHAALVAEIEKRLPETTMFSIPFLTHSAAFPWVGDDGKVAAKGHDVSNKTVAAIVAGAAKLLPGRLAIGGTQLSLAGTKDWITALAKSTGCDTFGQTAVDDGPDGGAGLPADALQTILSDAQAGGAKFVEIHPEDALAHGANLAMFVQASAA